MADFGAERDQLVAVLLFHADEPEEGQKRDEDKEGDGPRGKGKAIEEGNRERDKGGNEEGPLEAGVEEAEEGKGNGPAGKPHAEEEMNGNTDKSSYEGSVGDTNSADALDEEDTEGKVDDGFSDRRKGSEALGTGGDDGKRVGVTDHADGIAEDQDLQDEMAFEGIGGANPHGEQGLSSDEQWHGDQDNGKRTVAGGTQDEGGNLFRGTRDLEGGDGRQQGAEETGEDDDHEVGGTDGDAVIGGTGEVVMANDEQIHATD